MNYAEEHINELIADAYYDAAKDGSNDMFIITELLEKIKISLLKMQNKPYEAWNGLSLDRFRFDKENIIPVFVKLKNNYYEKYYEILKNELSKDFNYSAWLGEYVDSLIFLIGSVFNRLCIDNYPFSSEQIDEVKKFKKLNDFIMDGRWVEVYPLAEELSRNDLLTNAQKSSLQVQLGQIQLFWFPDYMNATKHFENATRLDSGNSFVNRGWGSYYMVMKDYEKSRSYYLLSMENDKTDVYNFTYTGDTYKEEGKNEIAEQWYRNAVNLDFTSYDPYSKLIQLYGNWDAAPERRVQIPDLLQKAEHLFPDTAFENMLYCIYRDTGGAYSDFGEYVTAEKFYTKAITLKPEYTMARIDLAYILAYQHKHDEAGAILKKINEEDENYYEVHWALAWLNEQDDTKKEEAITEYKKCIEIRPTWADRAYNSIGILYYNAGDYPRAKDFYDKAIETRDYEPVYYDNLLDVLKFEDKKNAEEILLKRFSLTPLDATFANKVGVYYFESNEYKKSLEYYLAAIRLNPENNVYYENTGLSYEELGMLDEAEKNYLKALELKQEYSTYNRLGIFYYRRSKEGDQQKAIEFYEKAISLSPENAVLHENLGLAYEKLGKLEIAEGEYKKAADYETVKGLYFNRLGFFYYSNFGIKKINLAIEYYQKSLERENSVLIYMENLALAYEVAEKWDNAAQIYEELLTKNEKDHYLRARLVSVLMQLGKDMYPKALDNILKCCDEDPDNIIYEKYLGEIYERMGQNNNALAIYEEILKNDPDDEYFNNRAGILNYVQYTVEGASRSIPYYEKAARANPHAGVYYQNIGLAYEKIGDIQEAKKAYERSIELEPDKAEMYDLMGAFYFRNKKIPKAIEMAEKAIRLNPNSETYYQNIAAAYELLPDLKQAESAYLKALEKNPANHVSQNQFGVFLFKNSQFERAIESYKKAIQLKPSESVYWQNLGLAYEKLGEYVGAEKAYLESISLDPTNAEYMNFLGVFYNLIKEYKKAIEWYQKAIDINPKQSLYHKNLGLAYEKLGDFIEAEKAYLESMRLDPANAENLNFFGEFYSLIKEYKKAIECYQKAIDLDPKQSLYYNNLGKAYELLNETMLSQMAYEKAKELEFSLVSERTG